MREPPDDRREYDVGNHLERERGTEHRGGIAPGEIIGQQRQGDRAEPGADERDDLCREQLPEIGIAERVDLIHGAHDSTPKTRAM